VAGWGHPATETGGDFYGWIGLPNGRTAVVVADVSGHGLGPAMVAVLCRAYARACLEGAGGLHDAATRLNRLLSTDVPPGMFATLVMVELSPGSDRVEVLSAGHGPIYLVRRGGEIESLEAAGLPLGVDESAEFAKGTVTSMAEGDTLVLVSDGVFERRREDGAMFGTARLQEVIRAEWSASEPLVHAIRDSADGFAAGTPAQDDVTIVAIRRTK
jgi:serine phosphatase RsbU (regulator of sigma subunit)